jgi:hypothetical protein
MRGFERQYRIRARCVAAAVACALLSSAALFSAALAQDAAPPPAPEQKSGVFESIGRFFDQGTTSFREHLQGAKRKMDDLGDEAAANSRAFGDGAATAGKNAAEATKGAVDGLAKLPTARIMTGREKCAVAPNGAPDCIVAAEQLCRKHGFASGKSMDFTSAEECPARAFLSGGSPAQCQTVTFINRAMCQ